MGVLIMVLVLDPNGSAVRREYIPFILGLDALFALAYGLNGAGYYRWAAAVTVMAAVVGPWGSAVLDPTVLHGDFVPLAYTIISVLLSSILLSPLLTTMLATVQLLGLALVAIASWEATPINWPSLLALVFTTSVLSILFTIISRDDLKQIDRQTQQLALSEAGLRELSVRDHLTGLFNRRYLEATLDREIRRSSRSQHTIGVILIDVDRFKEVNDAWGHAAGDLLLQQLGQLFMAHIRGGDIACRYGGDEFVIVLPEASRQATRQRAERVRDAVKQLEIAYHGLSLGAPTISAGVAMFPQHGASCEALLKSADQALYRAKAAGRDRVAGSAGLHVPGP
jgi:diguanylate cyclase (GGDEF)-like protein